MHKLRKIIFFLILVLTIVFALQKATNFYIERQINTYLAPYNITAKLERLNHLTVNYKGISLTCKIKIEGQTLVISPLKHRVFSKYLPEKIKIHLK